MPGLVHKILRSKESEVHYYVSGLEHETALLFLHPAFSDHQAFDYQVGYFAGNYRVITLDLLGHGASKPNASKEQLDTTAEHVEAILDQEGISQVHMVGVSLGSLLAQYFAFRYPGKVISLTALGGYPIHEENKAVAKAQRASNLRLLFTALISMNSFRKKVANISCFTTKGRALFLRSASGFQRKSFMLMQGLQKVIQQRDGVAIEYPMLIMVGEHDIPLAIEIAQRWYANSSDSEYVMIEHAGHCANMDVPEVFNETLERFLNRHSK